MAALGFEPALELVDELRLLGRTALKSNHENAMWWMREAFHAADLLLDDDCYTYRWNAENTLKFMRDIFGRDALPDATRCLRSPVVSRRA
jgi:hypothetical protein